MIVQGLNEGKVKMAVLRPLLLFRNVAGDDSASGGLAPIVGGSAPAKWERGGEGERGVVMLMKGGGTAGAGRRIAGTGAEESYLDALLNKIILCLTGRRCWGFVRRVWRGFRCRIGRSSI